MDRPDVCQRLIKLLLLLLGGSVLKTIAVLPVLLIEAKIQFEEHGCPWLDGLDKLLSDLRDGGDVREKYERVMTDHRFDLEELLGLLSLGLDLGPVEADRLEDLSLKDVEKKILLTIGDQTLICKKIAKQIGKYCDNSAFRSDLSNLRKRKILGNRNHGYFVRDEYRWLLSALRDEEGVSKVS